MVMKSSATVLSLVTLKLINFGFNNGIVMRININDKNNAAITPVKPTKYGL